MDPYPGRIICDCGCMDSPDVNDPNDAPSREVKVAKVSADFVDTAEVALAVHRKLVREGINETVADSALLSIITQFAHSATH